MLARAVWLAAGVSLGAGAGPACAQDQATAKLTAESRLRYETIDAQGLLLTPTDSDGYLLWRVSPILSVALGPQVDAVFEVSAAGAYGRVGGARPSDRNDLDLTQAYVRWSTIKDSTSLQIGRQELNIGSGRLLGTNEGANVRRRFDGAYLSTEWRSWTLLAEAAAVVDVRPGAFDDETSQARTVAGVGLVRDDRETGATALYLARSERDDTGFGGPGVPQVRWTLGAQWRRHTPEWSIEAEIIRQWGEAGQGRIGAWAAAGEARRQIREGQVSLWVKFAAASGDRSPSDRKSNAFDPLFANPAYAGAIALFGPTNSLALNPGVTLTVTPDLSMTADTTWFYRLSAGDSLYRFSGQALTGGPADDAGVLTALSTTWRISPEMRVTLSVAGFEAGPYFPADSDGTFGIMSLSRQWK